MRVNTNCADCLMDKQRRISKDANYLSEIQALIDNRKETDTAPYLIYLFNKVYEKNYGKREPYKEIKKAYNDLVLSMESEIRSRIEADTDPVSTAFAFARIGNYIDYGALDTVDSDTLLNLLRDTHLNDSDLPVMRSFRASCENAKTFLLIADNCGEIVLDKLFIEQLLKEYPQLRATVLVRGSEVLNDATAEDAYYVSMDDVADIVSSGTSVAGTIYDMLTDEARTAIDRADVILAKGQGNYESLCGQGRHIYYSLLCKCDLFIERFKVPKLTGMFIEENRD